MYQKGRVGKVGRLAVIEACRGKRIGSILMTVLERHARRLQLEMLSLDAVLSRVPFYERWVLGVSQNAVDHGA